MNGVGASGGGFASTAKAGAAARCGRALALALAAFALSVVAGGASVAEEGQPDRKPRIGLRVFDVRPAGPRHGNDCNLWIEIENRLTVAIGGLTVEIAPGDAAGQELGRKSVTFANLLPGGSQRAVIGMPLPVLRERGLGCGELKRIALRVEACMVRGRNLLGLCDDALGGAEPSLLEVTRARGRAQAVAVNRPPTVRRAGAPERRALPRLGLTVEAITDDVAREHGLGDDVAGLIVAAVAAGAAAETKGLRAGDVIVEIDQEEVFQPADAAAHLDSAERSGRSLLVLYRRDGEFHFVTLPVE